MIVWLSGISLFTFLGLIAVQLFTSLAVVSNPLLVDQIMQPGNLNAARILQIFSSFGMFVFPGWLFAHLMNHKITGQHPRPLLVIVAIVIPLMALPLVNWLSVFNGTITFPIPSVDYWMKTAEADAGRAYTFLLEMKGIPDLGINLFMMALVPAVGEELFFRASIQPYFEKIMRNKHLAVWATAFFFSAIHIQFYTFIPRFIMGAGLGYLFLFGQNINYAIVAHFTNNAVAVLLAYFVVNDATMEKLDSIGSSFFPWVMASIIAMALLYGIFIKSTKKARNA